MPATIDLTKDTGAPDAEEQLIAEKGNCGSSGREENGVGQSAKGKEKEIEEGGGVGEGKRRERRKGDGTEGQAPDGGYGEDVAGREMDHTKGK